MAGTNYNFVVCLQSCCQLYCTSPATTRSVGPHRKFQVWNDQLNVFGTDCLSHQVGVAGWNWLTQETFKWWILLLSTALVQPTSKMHLYVTFIRLFLFYLFLVYTHAVFFIFSTKNWACRYWKTSGQTNFECTVF